MLETWNLQTDSWSLNENNEPNHIKPHVKTSLLNHQIAWSPDSAVSGLRGLSMSLTTLINALLWLRFGGQYQGLFQKSQIFMFVNVGFPTQFLTIGWKPKGQVWYIILWQIFSSFKLTDGIFDDFACARRLKV